jgi:hypothetical protein
VCMCVLHVQAHFERERRHRILATFLEGRVNASCGRVCVGSRDESAAVLDTLAYFVRIVTPPLRPVNFDLLVGKEKEDFEALVGTLMSWAVTFRPVHDDFGRDLAPSSAGAFRMDPYGLSAAHCHCTRPQ